MESTRRSRRHRNPQSPETQQVEQQQPFFSKTTVGSTIQTKLESAFFQPKLTIGQANDQYEKIKVCDVLSIKSGHIIFGSPVFEIADIQGVRKQKLHRLVLNYSADAVLRLNYDPEMNIVIHDHLEQIGTKDPNIPFTYVPDGTYEAFELQKDGIWLHVDKLANTELKTAPRPKPTLNSRNRVKSAKDNAQKVVWPEEVKKNNQK